MKTTLGFIGLGAMGGGMCMNLAQKSGCEVLATDLDMQNVYALSSYGVIASNIAEIASRADTVFLSLPSINEVEQVCLGEQGLLANAGSLKTIVDMSTSEVERVRALASTLQERGVSLIDAPVARSRAAAKSGTLLITVGARQDQFDQVKPYLDCMGSDVLLCGPTGAGQVVKAMNNMVLINTVHALAAAFAISERSGVSKDLLSQVLGLGSAASFALKLTGADYLAKDTFPEKMFSASYALKDLKLALGLSASVEVDNELTAVTARKLQQAIDVGYADNYYPVMYKMMSLNSADSL
ncbi:NAD(P)-dependent oxidoreductase [Bordetella genomosp. 4]|uniref:2-hydroxy-3-oxopropionate reductase n=1 Tax=Bordetella genomosp. 4 TaxID=463044 RepID=A0A261U6Y5_9BORD|nr:NAD(P)-dependent oxidoreductase [Bordetella genomosp. 4]OZI56623.1 2-hydroxy-3-oxopropionate reductase [Bordetella genomosp. 4]